MKRVIQSLFAFFFFWFFIPNHIYAVEADIGTEAQREAGKKIYIMGYTIVPVRLSAAVPSAFLQDLK